MAWLFTRSLISKQRTLRTNRQLGAILAAVAGAVNAGGFLAVQRYTSHMTGIVSAIADELAIGNTVLALAGCAALLAFIAGAMVTTILINRARRRGLHSEYAGPLMVEAVLLLFFGLSGANTFVPSIVSTVCEARLRCLRLMGDAYAKNFPCRSRIGAWDCIHGLGRRCEHRTGAHHVRLLWRLRAVWPNDRQRRYSGHGAAGFSSDRLRLRCASLGIIRSGSLAAPGWDHQRIIER